ncbi:MAG: hypothetical protein RL238_3051 [Actinomycetota bacterium]
MFPPSRPVTAVPELLRLGACLLHAIPYAVGSIDIGQRGQHVVAHHRPDATLTPCQLRMGLLEPVVDGVPHLVDAITSLEVIGGAVDLGGGLFQSGHPSGPEQRWFATRLSADAVEDIAARCPADLGHTDISVRVIADTDMDVCAIRMSGDGAGLRLDAVACWLYEQCLVEELLASTK